MSQKIKISVKLKSAPVPPTPAPSPVPEPEPVVPPVPAPRSDNTYPFDDLEFTNPRTKANYKSALTALNSHFKWTSGLIHVDKMNRNTNKIIEFIKNHYALRTVKDLSTKLGIYSSLITRTGLVQTNHIKHAMKDCYNTVVVPTVTKTEVTPDWIAEVLPALENIIQTGSSTCVTLATLFKYGYVLRTNQIFSTTLTDDGVSNYLDLDNCIWYIRTQKNRKIKEFEIERELIDLLRPSKPQRYLIHKSTGDKYGKTSLSYHEWPTYNSVTLRHSYETWNVYGSGRTLEEQNYWHDVLGHTRATVLGTYANRPDDESDDESLFS